MKKLLLALLLLASPAQAQDGTNHSMPVFGGAGFSGFREAGPCAAGQALTWASSVVDPTCVSVQPALTFPLTVAQGGTGLATLTNHGILVGQGTANLTFTGPCTLGFFVGGAGASADPTCQGFVGVGTGGATRTWQTKVQEIVYSVKDYGAVCDNSTNDATAIQAAVNAAQAAVGGVVFFPGACRTQSTITISSGQIKLRGDVMLGSGIITTSDIKLVSLGGGRHTIEDLQLLGVGVQGGTGTSVSGTSHVLHITSSCVDCLVRRLFITGGYNGIQNDGADSIIEDTVATAVYGDALVQNQGVAMWMRRAKIDTPWPVSVPAGGASKAAWASATAYSVGDVRLHPSGFYMQVRVAGTSGGGAPTLQNYGTDIVDGVGALRWRLVSRLNSNALRISTGASETHVEQSDFTGAQGSSAIRIDNDGAGVAPFLTTITDSVLSQTFGSSFDAVAGSGLNFSGNEVASPIDSSAGGISLRASWTGNANIVNNQIFGDTAAGHIGVYLGAGTNAVVAGNVIVNWVTGVLVDNAVSKFSISANSLNVNTTAVSITAAAHDNYVVFGNITTGSGTAISDGGTGTAKVVQSSEGDFTARKVISSAAGWLQNTPVAVASLPTCNGAADGSRAFVNNSNAASFATGIGAAVVGGGTLHVPVFCDGASWKIG